ncbi:MAG TPA: hypothetical protein VH206_08385 [Xanthobacteraceae bacterium]|jgi:hypothetical protein|nr:hypothetical protein [Xanthobacteraceae bacterium]
MVSVTASDRPADEPVTLHRIMQTMIGDGLRKRYEAPQKLSHELFVLLMQLKEQESRPARATSKRKAKAPRAELSILDAVAK